MPAKGSRRWYAERREPSKDRPALPVKSQEQMVAEALERLKKLARDKKDDPLHRTGD